MGLASGTGNWDWQLGLVTGDWDWQLGLAAGTGNWDWQLGLATGTGNWDPGKAGYSLLVQTTKDACQFVSVCVRACVCVTPISSQTTWANATKFGMKAS